LTFPGELWRVNDFVNPKNRGASLPHGYKDLIEVLEAKKNPKTTSAFNTAVTASFVGGLAHVEEYLRRFVASKSGSGLIFKSPGRVERVCLAKFGNITEAMFCFLTTDTDREKIVRETFLRFGIAPKPDQTVIGEIRVVEYDLPAALSDLISVFTQVLRDAYGASVNAGVEFFYWE
jgi:hypothetical protein